MPSIRRRAPRTNAVAAGPFSLRATILSSLWLASSLFASALQAQVDVTATVGTPEATYATLGAAFAAVNVGTHKGVITIGISEDTTEPVTASLSRRASPVASPSGVNHFALRATLHVQPWGPLCTVSVA